MLLAIGLFGLQAAGAGRTMVLPTSIVATSLAAFTYDMGGRVGPEGPLYHQVIPGIDREFTLLIEFDWGPQFIAE